MDFIARQYAFSPFLKDKEIWTFVERWSSDLKRWFWFVTV